MRDDNTLLETVNFLLLLSIHTVYYVNHILTLYTCTPSCRVGVFLDPKHSATEEDTVVKRGPRFSNL